MARKVALACGGNLRGKTIAVLGLTFKPNTDDMREAPSIEIIAGLQRAGAHVRAHDPIGRKQASLHLEGVEFCADPYECAEGAHALTIITDWDCYRVLDPFRLKAALRTPTIVDLRNCLNGEAMQKHGLHYVSVGLPSVWRGASDRRQDLRRAVELAGAVPAAADL